MVNTVQQSDSTAQKTPLSSKLSYEELLTPTSKRGWGIKIEYLVFIAVLALGCYLLIGGLFVQDAIESLLGESGNIDLFGFPLSVILTGGPLILGVLGLLFVAPAFASIRMTRWRYRNISRMIPMIPDRRKGEGVARVLPIVIADRRKYAVVNCPRAGYLSGPPLAMALINEKGIPVANDELFDRALMTYDFACATIQLQGYYGAQLTRLRKEIKKQIPRVRAILQRNRSPFEAQKVELFAQQAETGLGVIETAFRERERYLNALFDYFKAAGYGFVTEYHYEDASRLRSLDLAFAAEMEVKYRLPAQVSAAAAAALLEQIKTHPKGWHRRNELVKALNYLDEGRKVIEQWIYLENVQFEKERQMRRDCYHQKLENLRARHIPVVSE